MKRIGPRTLPCVIIFIIYISPLGKILRDLGIQYHFYADDSQLYVTFNINDADKAVKKVEEAVNVIKEWMSQNFLCLNEDKTEVILIASKSIQKKLQIPHITVGSEEIVPAKEAKNIGFIFDYIMDSKKQISATCKSAWFHLRNVGKIRQYLDKKSTEQLIHSFVTSKLDYNNCLLYGLPDTLLLRLQRIQNAAARLVLRLPKHCHITPTLQDLHWLPIKHRINYKILLMVFKALNNCAPSYIADLLTKKPECSINLRSNGNNFLMVPKSNTVTYGDRNFRNMAPILWNNLPNEIRDCHEINVFKRLLKTYLFKDAY